MFDPTGHSLLSEPAAALEPSTLIAHARLAEDLLAVVPAAYDALDADQQRRWGEMIVLQINYQLTRRDAEALVQEAFSGGQQSYRWHGWISEAARALRDRYFAGSAGVEGAFRLDAFYEEES